LEATVEVFADLKKCKLKTELKPYNQLKIYKKHDMPLLFTVSHKKTTLKLFLLKLLSF
jgi:hypothetical protein